MALRPLPIRDPERAAREPQHSREYVADLGGWLRPEQPAPGTPKENQGASR